MRYIYVFVAGMLTVLIPYIISTDYYRYNEKSVDTIKVTSVYRTQSELFGYIHSCEVESNEHIRYVRVLTDDEVIKSGDTIVLNRTFWCDLRRSYYAAEVKHH